MRHMNRWVLLLTLSTLISLVGPAAAPIHAARAWQEATAPSAPEAFPSSEIVLIESSGRIRVDAPNANPMTRWTSGSDVGWQNIAAGNFDGNALNYQQIAAVRGSEIKVFAPFPNSTVIMDMTAPSGWYFDLLAVGDFDGDGLQEIAASYHRPGLADANVAVYHYVANSLTWTYTTLAPVAWAANWQDMQAGNINGDTNQGRPIDDLLLVRQPGHLLKAFLGTTTPGVFSELPDNTESGFPYLALAVGKIHTDANVHDEVVTSRSVPSGASNTILLWRLVGTGFVDITPYGTGFNPQFTSISLADVNGDGRKELLMLRDPQANNVALKILNLVNTGDPGFETAIGYGSSAWRTVRGGDIDSDGMAETVVLRGDQYRIYDDAAHGYAQGVSVGGSFFINTATANATSLLVTNLDGGSSSLVPVLLASPSVVDLGSVRFGEQSSIQVLSLTNSGPGDAIHWTAQVSASSSAWLHIDLTQGTTPASIHVWADSVAAQVGIHTGDILISTSDANVPVAVPDVQVKFTVTDPGFAVSPSEVSVFQAVGEPPATRTLEIVKPSPGQVTWYAGAVGPSDAPTVLAKLAAGSAKVTAEGVLVDGQIVAAPAWLSLNPDHGTVGDNITDSIGITLNPSAGVGLHRALITVYADDPSLPNFVRTVLVNYFVSNTVYRSYMPQIAK